MKKSNEAHPMNPEDFEQQLSRQTIRPIPSPWRSQILSAARAAATPSSPREPFAVKLWRELFWSSRRIWGGLAAIWVAILVISTASDDSPRSIVAAAPPSRDWKLALQAQHQMMRQLLEQDSPPAPTSALPGRRTERIEMILLG